MVAILKLTSATVAVAAASVIQAAPLSCRSSCHDGVQSASTGDVTVGSATKIVPVIEVTPIMALQTIVRSHAPIVQSACPEPLAAGRTLTPNKESGRFGPGLDHIVRLSRERFLNRVGHLIPNNACSPPTQRPNERDDIKPKAEERQCISTAQSRELVLPPSITNIGSIVQVKPSNVVLPSTTCRVQSKEAQVNYNGSVAHGLSRGPSGPRIEHLDHVPTLGDGKDHYDRSRGTRTPESVQALDVAWIDCGCTSCDNN